MRPLDVDGSIACFIAAGWSLILWLTGFSSSTHFSLLIVGATCNRQAGDHIDGAGVDFYQNLLVRVM